MRHRAVLFLAALSACAPSGSTPTPSPVPLSRISVDDLRRDLAIIAADSMEGRETGSSGARSAGRFIANRLVEMGLEPAGDSMYHQRVPLVRQSFGGETVVAVRSGQSTIPLALGTDVVPMVNLGPGAPLPRRNAEGEIFFAGYGMNTNGRNDFRGISEAGKVIVMLHGAPPGIADTALRSQLESQQELGMRLGRALQLQPAAIVLLMTGGATDFYTQAAPELMRSVTAAPGDRSTSDSERPLPMVVLGLARAGSPLLPDNWRTDDSPRALGKTFHGRIDLRQDAFTGYNLVGVVRGTDPALNKSYVGFGAHYDHIGVQHGMSPDSIANGADDDGSGTVSLLALAGAMKRNPPRRSVLFVWHTGEEKGLLGSAHFTNNPTVPIDSIVAMLNLDMVGRRGGATASFNSQTEGASAANRVFVVGPAAAPNNQSRVLGAILDTVNARQLRPLEFDRVWDSPDHPERIYFRSDHFNYAQKGIPILFFTTGLHEDYHKVSDEIGKIDFDKMSRIGVMLLELGTTLGNREARPR